MLLYVNYRFLKNSDEEDELYEEVEDTGEQHSLQCGVALNSYSNTAEFKVHIVMIMSFKFT